MRRRHHPARDESGTIRPLPAIKAFLLCLLLGGTAVGYVAQKNKIYELGAQITLREECLRQLQKENKARASHLGRLQMPQVIAMRVRELNLGLQPPQPGQVVWLPEPETPSPTNGAPPLQMVQQ
ncbi:MAG: hypothetical protein JXQ71_13910 [Verrucomicrobia bacterium]|nr:hypothetical protein [Verrucomicrobiota bacterium]